MTLRKVSLALAGLVILGCSGLAGYGAELGSTEITQPGTFDLVFTPPAEGPYDVWLAFELEGKGGYAVNGDFKLAGKQQPGKTWKLQLDDSGSPVVGESGRIVLNHSSSTMGGVTRASATIYLVELPPLKAGSKARIKGQFVPAVGTTIHGLRLIVTE